MPLDKKYIKTIFLEPTYSIFYEDRLFDATRYQDPSMALPYIRLKNSLESQGVQVHTADYFRTGRYLSKINEYWSIGTINQVSTLESPNIIGVGFILLEPPLIDSKIYENLSYISTLFKRVYLYNPISEIKNSYRVFIPIPYKKVIDNCWSNQLRQDKIVIISGNHAPFFKSNELYSKRIECINYFAKYNSIDLFGRNWDLTFNRRTLWWKYLLNYFSIMKVYKGPTDNKHQTLANYKYSICFENSEMRGYITEKIFDCFYAGTVPIYHGAPDISDFIDPNSYIDFKNFRGLAELKKYLDSLSKTQYLEMKENGKKFIEKQSTCYYDFLQNAVLTDGVNKYVD
jgi:hypothetical protein